MRAITRGLNAANFRQRPFRIARMLGRAVTVGGVLVAAPLRELTAQTIAVQVGDSASMTVPNGAKIRIPVNIDLSRAGNLRLASLQASVTWNPARLTFDSIRVAQSSGFSQIADPSTAGTGGLLFSAYSTGAMEASGALTNLFFTAGSTAGSTVVQVSPSVAGSEAGEDITSRMVTRSLSVCIGGETSGNWGDTNNDGTVNIIDAQQIARHSVALSVSNVAVLTSRGDVNADGNINIIDAQQIARYSVGLSAAQRINTPISSSAGGTVASIVVAPTARTLRVGEGLVVTADPRDATGSSLAGCSAITWSSNASAVATVTPAGVVTAVAPGTATITASSGGRSGTATITVPAPQAAVATVSLAGTVSTGEVGQTRQLSATVRDSAGATLSGRTVTWSSSNVVVATVSSAGLVTFNAAGAVTITAIVEGISDNVALTVTPTGGTGGGSEPASSLALGTSHSCALNASNLAFCWGWNQAGKLGDGTSVNRAVPTGVAGTTPFMMLTAGDGHTCGLTASGMALCWGRNESLQLGAGTTDTTPSLTPRPVSGGLTFRTIAAGESGVCGLVADGSAYCWGVGGVLSSGSLVRASTPTLVSESLRFVRIAMGSSMACGLTSEGQAYCWGQGEWGQRGDGTTTLVRGPTLVLGGHRFADLAARSATVCGITSDAVGLCWGRNVGDSTSVSRSAPTRVTGGARFARLRPSGSGGCGLTLAGTVQCWGNNTGNGTSTFFSYPVAVSSGATFRDLDVGTSHACASTSTGETVCWGSNLVGEIGNGGTATALQPATVTGFSARPDTRGVSEVAVVPPDALVYVNRPSQLVAAPRSQAGGFLAGRSATWSSETPSVAMVSPSGVVTGVAAGAATIVATVDGRRGARSYPVFRSSVTFVQVSPATTIVADGQSVQLTGTPTDSTGAPLTDRTLQWESSDTLVARVNAQGVVTGVGAGTATIRARSEGKVGSATVTGRLRRVTSATVTPATVTLSVGGVIQPGLTMRDSSGGLIPGRAVTWNSSATNVASVGAGTGLVTALANGTATIRATIDGVSATLSVTVSGGSSVTPDDASTFGVGNGDFACAVTAAGPVQCWGKNDKGQLGDGTTASRSAPAPLQGGLALAVVAAGYDHACGLTPAGLSMCWGSDSDGQLGNGPASGNTSVPAAVVGSVPLRAITAGGFHSCGLAAGGAAFCWGRNLEGQLGDGTTASQQQPVAVTGGLSFTRIDAGAGHTCGLTAAGAMYCWGSNGRGQLGNGSLTSTSAPTQVSGNLAFADLSLGVTSTCALTTDQRAFCWGWNESGQVGDGSRVDRTTPTEVVGGLRFASISAAFGVTCGLTSAGSAYCWGANGAGQIGDGTWNAAGSPPRTAPTPVAGGLVFRQLSQGISATHCGLTATGQAYCWPDPTMGLTSSSPRPPTLVSGAPALRLAGAPVASVTVSPSTVARRIGETAVLAAVTLDAGGRALAGRSIAWSTSNSNVATVSSSGLMTGMGAGSATITATSEGRSGSATITVTAVPVASLTVSPATVVTTVGLTTQLAALVADSAGRPLNGRAVSWTSSTPSVASVNASGLLSALATGTTAITATSEGRTASATVQVSATVAVASVQVSPAEVALVPSSTRQVTAAPLDANGAPLVRQVVWSSSNPAVATVTNAGLITATAPGVAAVTATSEGRSATVNVTVAAAITPVAAVSVSPGTLAIGPGQSGTLVATPQDSTGAPLAGRLVTWSSSAPAIATVAATGVVSGIAPGTTVVTASSEGRTTTVNVTVTISAQPVASVAVVPGSSGLQSGQTLTLTATPRDGGGAPLSGRSVSWNSSSPSVASVSGTGVVTGLSPGTARITATSEGVVGAATISVTGSPVTNVTLAPPSASLLPNGTVQLSVTARDTAGTVVTGRPVVFTSSNPNIATVTSTGLVTGLALGSTGISATIEGRTATIIATVTTPISVGTVTIAPGQVRLTTGQNQSLAVTYRDATGAVLANRDVAWESSNPLIASVSPSGVVSAGAVQGTALVRATVEGVTGTATVIVSSPVPTATVRVVPPVVTVVQGGSYQFSASAMDSSGNVLGGKTFSWRSSNTAAAPISSAGVLTAQALGQYDILATSDNVTGMAQVIIVPVPIATITVTPPQPLKIVGQALQMTATLRDSTGALITNRPLSWFSSNPQVAAVTAASGLVTAVSPGTATIRARADGITGATTMTVILVPVKAVVVAPATISVQAKTTVQFSAVPIDSAGGAITTSGSRLAGRLTSWSSSDTMKATVTPNGLVTTKAEGAVDIMATIDGVTGKGALTIVRPAPARVSVAPAARNLAIGQSLQLTATALDSFNVVLPGRAFSWASSGVEIASVNQAGLANAMRWGEITVSASTEGTTGTTTVIVSDTLWRKISSLPAGLAGQNLARPTYDYQSGTIFVARRDFDGVIWKRDQLGTWTRVTPPQGTFGTCISLHFDSVNQDIIVATCSRINARQVWRVSPDDGRVTATTGLDTRLAVAVDREDFEIWDPVEQRISWVDKPVGWPLTRGGYVDGGAGTSWHAPTGTLVQGSVILDGCRAFSPRCGFWVDRAMYVYRSATRAWTTVMQPDEERTGPSFSGAGLWRYRLAYCAQGSNAVWRMAFDTQLGSQASLPEGTLERTVISGGPFSVRALFAMPQAEAPLGYANTTILCDGARNQLWVIGSHAQGGGIWRYLGNP